MRFPTMWYIIIIYGYILLFFYFCFRFSQKMKTKDLSKSYVKIHKANKYVFTLCILITHPMVLQPPCASVQSGYLLFAL